MCVSKEHALNSVCKFLTTSFQYSILICDEQENQQLFTDENFEITSVNVKQRKNLQNIMYLLPISRQEIRATSTFQRQNSAVFDHRRKFKY